MISVTHDTLLFSQTLNAPLPAVWDAFSDPVQRVLWSLPAGEAQMYDRSDFSVGGQDIYRCGPPQTLEYHGVADYIEIIPESLIIYTEKVAVGGRVLTVALVTWQFETEGPAVQVRLTDQVTSFVGVDMIAGHRNGHRTALEQLRDYVEGRELTILPARFPAPEEEAESFRRSQ